jgi:hypothetical protein
LLFLMAASIMLVIAACTNSGSNQGGSGYNAPASPPAASPPTSAPVSSAPQQIKLSDTPYWKAAHLISGDTIDAAGQSALAGFNVDKKVMPDGTTQITLTTTTAGYVNQSYTLQPGQQLYFIETSMGDDRDNQEFNLGDDKAVIVDAQGYVVQN